MPGGEGDLGAVATVAIVAIVATVATDGLAKPGAGTLFLGKLTQKNYRNPVGTELRCKDTKKNGKDDL